jgi:tyrosyl-tRNA synthetase
MENGKKLDIIRKNTEEIVTEQELGELLGRKSASAYIGYAPTGRLHIGYFIPVIKIKDLMDAGVKMTFLIADLHAHLDDLKTPWELLDARSKY